MLKKLDNMHAAEWLKQWKAACGGTREKSVTRSFSDMIRSMLPTEVQT